MSGALCGVAPSGSVSTGVRDTKTIAHAVAGKKDPVTRDSATGRSAFHEKAAWTLRAIATS